MKRAYSQDTLKSGSVNLLVLVDSTHAFLSESSKIEMDGGFTFSVADSNYIVLAIPDTIMYPGLIPTFYGDKSTWQDARIIRPSAGIPPYNINCIELHPLSGQSVITGLINDLAAILKVAGRPMKPVSVFLVEKGPTGDSIVAMTITNDSSGTYQFTNVPDGTYDVIVNIAGVNQIDTLYAILTPDVRVINNLNYSITTNGIEKMKDATIVKTNSVNIKIYPNPSSGIFTIDFNGIVNRKSILLYDLKGKRIISHQNSDNEYQIDLAGFSNGIYLLRVTTDQGTINSKLIKE